MPGEGDPVGEFGNTCGEVHAIWFGLTDNLFSIDPSNPQKSESLDEPQYYRLGCVIAKGIQIGVGILLGYLIFT
jgi:hypothetical protein